MLHGISIGQKEEFSRHNDLQRFGKSTIDLNEFQLKATLANEFN
jgi:hypothetical protein